jgi:RNA polymerase sigma-70 factor, ECF subfamily
VSAKRATVRAPIREGSAKNSERRAVACDKADGRPIVVTRVHYPPDSPCDDSALVGSVEAWLLAASTRTVDLQRTIEQTLYRVLRRRPSEFEDLAQITYERVIRTLGEGRFEGRAQLATWAGAIAARVAVEWLRRQSREQRLLNALGTTSLAAEVHMPQRKLEARSEIRRVQAILGRMNSKAATVLVLHDMVGYSVPELAQILGIGASAAQTRLRRARAEFVKRCTATASRIRSPRS